MSFFLENIYIFLAFAIAFQALIFAILFLRSRKGSHEKIIGYYKLIYFLNYSLVLLFLIEEYRLFIYSYYLVIPFFGLFPVLFYFFIKKLSRGSLQKKDMLHFLFPAALLITNLVILPFLSYPERYAVIIENSIIEETCSLQKFLLTLNKSVYPLLLAIQPFIYIVFCAKEIKYLRKKILEEYSFSKDINLKWAVKFLVIFTVFFFVALFLDNMTFNLSFVLLINMIIGVEGIHYRTKTNELKDFREIDDNADVKKHDKYLYSSMQEIEKSTLYKRILEYMTVNKNYLNPDLRLTDMAKTLGVNRQYISQVINERTGENFYHFVNKFRIQEFSDMYQSKQFRNMTIEGVSSMVGFKSKSSFFSAFKRIKGCTPREFIKSNP